jgi:hypothetical protein
MDGELPEYGVHIGRYKSPIVIARLRGSGGGSRRASALASGAGGT